MKKAFLFAAFLFFAQGLFAQEFPSEISGLNLITEKNETVNLRDQKYQGSLVVFLSSHCPCSNCHLAELKKLQEKFPNFQFIGIHSNMDEDLASAKDYFQKSKIGFQVFRDEKTYYADLFKAVKTPHAFLLDLKGHLLFAGGVSSSKDASKADHFYLREALTDLQQGRQVQTKEARTLGCLIARTKAENENIWK